MHQGDVEVQGEMTVRKKATHDKEVLMKERLEVQGNLEAKEKATIHKEARFKDEIVLEKLKMNAPAQAIERYLLIDQNGRVIPGERVPPGMGLGGGGNGGIGNISLCNPDPKAWCKDGTTLNLGQDYEQIKIGTSSLFLGSSTSGTVGTANYIRTTGGALFIQDNSLENTVINPRNHSHVGIGTSNPQKKLHIFTSHSDIDDMSHYGIRLQDNKVEPGNGSFISSSIWDIEPVGETEKLHIGKPGHDYVMTFTSDKKVGVGTDDPDEKLTVEGGNLRVDDNYDILLRNSHHGVGWYGRDGLTPSKKFAGENIDGPVLYGWRGGALGAKHGSTETVVLRWNENGNVGIGTEPDTKLHVAGTVRITGVSGTAWTTGGWLAAMETPLGYVWRSTTTSSVVSGKYLGYGMTNSGWYWITADGTSGADYRYPMQLTLDNCGKPTLRVREDDWCDYVFEEGYQRPSFEEQEAQLKKEKHLRGIAPEQEIVENGLDITGTMKGLTLNVEEMRLDMIELYKMIKKQKKLIEEQQKEIERLNLEIDK